MLVTTRGERSSSRRAFFVVAALVAVLAITASTADPPGGLSSPAFAGSNVRTCSLGAAVRSLGRVFRGIRLGNAQEILSGFVEPGRSGDEAWGFQIEREEDGPQGLNEDPRSSRLIGTTPKGIERLASIRRHKDERLELVVLRLDVTPIRQRVPLTIYYLRRAKDVIGYGWGDAGIAKGQFDCDAGRLVWFRGGHIPSQVPVAPSASGRLVCVKRPIQQRVFVPGIGWGCI